MRVSEVVNEHGFKCTYHFKDGFEEILLKRAADIQRNTSCGLKASDRGMKTQKILLYLKENKDALQVFYDINYLMKVYNCDVQEAGRILCKHTTPPPHFFWMRSNKSLIFSFAAGNRYLDITMEELIRHILPILPKSYLEGLRDPQQINWTDKKD